MIIGKQQPKVLEALVWAKWDIVKNDFKKGRTQIRCEVSMGAFIGSGNSEGRVKSETLLMFCETIDDVDPYAPEFVIAEQLYFSLSKEFPFRKMTISVSLNEAHGYMVSYDH
jgi:hypothetical protein